MNEKILKHDDEIELMDILLVIWRCKFFIISMIALSTIIAAVYVFSAPMIYKCSMNIKPAVLKQNNSSEMNTIVSATDIIAVINSKVLKDGIIKSLKLSKKNLYKSGLNFNVRLIKKTDNIKVIYYCYKSDQGIAILNALVNFLNEYFQSEIDFFMEQPKQNISGIDLQINSYKNQLRRALAEKNYQINYILRKIDYFEKRKVDSEKEVAKIKERIKSIKRQKDGIDKKYNVLIDRQKTTRLNEKDIFLFELKLDRVQAQEYDSEMLLLRKQNEMAENFVRFQDLFIEKRNAQEKYLIAKQEIDLLISRLETNKKIELNEIHNNLFAVQTLVSPVSSSKPVKPKKKSILFSVFIFSFLISIFCIFVFEYFRRYSKKTV